jgi:hypothetical protein
VTKIASLASLPLYKGDTASPVLHCSEAVSEAVSLMNSTSEASEAIITTSVRKILKYFFKIL